MGALFHELLAAYFRRHPPARYHLDSPPWARAIILISTEQTPNRQPT